MDALNGLQILVVEDDEDNRVLLSLILAEQGMKVVCACSASEALAALAVKPDLLISNIRMPEEDGISLIRRVRKLSAEEGGHIPAIALSTLVTQQDQQQALAAGYQVFIPKPYDIDELLRIVADVGVTRRYSCLQLNQADISMG